MYVWSLESRTNNDMTTFDIDIPFRATIKLKQMSYMSNLISRRMALLRNCSAGYFFSTRNFNIHGERKNEKWMYSYSSERQQAHRRRRPIALCMPFTHSMCCHLSYTKSIFAKNALLACFGIQWINPLVSRTISKHFRNTNVNRQMSKLSCGVNAHLVSLTWKIIDWAYVT